MLTTEIKTLVNKLKMSPNWAHDWYVLTTEIKSPADGLKTSPNELHGWCYWAGV